VGGASAGQGQVPQRAASVVVTADSP